MTSPDFILGGYIPGTSSLHRLDARVKTVSFLLFIIVVFTSSDVRSLVLSAIATIVVIVAAKLGRHTWFSAFHRFAWLLVLIALMNLIFYDHGVRPTLLGWQIPFSLESMGHAVSILAQVSMGIALSVVLTATTLPTEFIKGLRNLAQPMKKFGLPVDEASTAIYMALRFVPILHEEVRNIVEAQKSRGIDFRVGNLKRRASALSSVLAPALQATLRRADKLAVAMQVRGYRQNSRDMAFSSSPLSTLDVWALIVSALLAISEVTLKIL